MFEFAFLNISHPSFLLKPRSADLPSQLLPLFCTASKRALGRLAPACFCEATFPTPTFVLCFVETTYTSLKVFGCFISLTCISCLCTSGPHCLSPLSLPAMALFVLHDPVPMPCPQGSSLTKTTVPSSGVDGTVLCTTGDMPSVWPLIPQVLP